MIRRIAGVAPVLIGLVLASPAGAITEPVAIQLSVPPARVVHNVSAWTTMHGLTTANATAVKVYAIEKRGSYYYSYDAPACADVPPGACSIALPHWTRHGKALASAQKANPFVVPAALNTRTHRWTASFYSLPQGRLFLRYSASRGSETSAVHHYSVVLNHP